MPGEKLDIFRVLNAIDNKHYGFYDTLTEEERKTLAPFVAMKWNASVSSSKEIQHYYVAATNHYANKHLFDLSKHQKLQWLLLCAASPGIGKQRHEWLKATSSPKTSPIEKELREYFSHLKDDELHLLASITTKQELKQYKLDNGIEK